MELLGAIRPNYYFIRGSRCRSTSTPAIFGTPALKISFPAIPYNYLIPPALPRSPTGKTWRFDVAQRNCFLQQANRFRLKTSCSTSAECQASVLTFKARGRPSRERADELAFWERPWRGGLRATTSVRGLEWVCFHSEVVHWTWFE